MKQIEKRINALEAMQSKERDFRQTLQWPAYRDTLLKLLADYPQKGLLQDVQKAFDDLDGRSGPVTDADVFYAIDPLLRKHFKEFAPNPETADHLALVARFEAVGLPDDCEEMQKLRGYARKYQEEDKYRIVGECAGCGTNIKEAPHKWGSRWHDDLLETVPWCSECYKSRYPT